MKLQNPRIRLFIGVFVAKIYGRGNLSRIADGAEWLLLEVISLSQSGDNLQNVRSNRDLLLQSPEVTITTGRPPPSWQLCHYMAYHPAIPKYEHKTIISSYYVGKLQRLLMLAFFNNIIHRTIY